MIIPVCVHALTGGGEETRGCVCPAPQDGLWELSRAGARPGQADTTHSPQHLSFSQLPPLFFPLPDMLIFTDLLRSFPRAWARLWAGELRPGCPAF